METKRMVVFYSPAEIKRLDQATDRLLEIRNDFMQAHNEVLLAISGMRVRVQSFMYAAEEAEKADKTKAKPARKRRRRLRGRMDRRVRR